MVSRETIGLMQEFFTSMLNFIVIMGIGTGEGYL